MFVLGEKEAGQRFFLRKIIRKTVSITNVKLTKNKFSYWISISKLIKDNCYHKLKKFPFERLWKV